MLDFKNFFSLCLLVTIPIVAGGGCTSSHNSIEGNTRSRQPSSYTVTSYPILEKLEASGQTLSPETKKWMERWKNLDLEDRTLYYFPELSGSTSINMKVRKHDSSDKAQKAGDKEGKAWGSFVPRNGAANFNTEIAYFNLSAILGMDHVFRPAVRYQIGPYAKARLQHLIETTNIQNENRVINKKNILSNIQSPKDLLGCMKAKKMDEETTFNEIVNSQITPNGGPNSRHALIAFLQASNPKPTAGKSLTLRKGYVGDEAELAREYSVITMFDAIFQQWDRYSYDNVSITKDDQGKAHFYYTDNGGAEISAKTSWVTRNLDWFSRYHRGSLEKLKQVYAFLMNPASGFLGYTNAEEFIVDLGMYAELSPKDYVERIKRNMKMLFDDVDSKHAKYGDAIYLN